MNGRKKASEKIVGKEENADNTGSSFSHGNVFNVFSCYEPHQICHF